MQKPCISPVIRNTHLGIYMNEGEIDCVKPLRFGELSLTATAVAYNKHTFTFTPRIFLKMILNIKYKSTTVKKRKQEILVFPFFFPKPVSNFDGPSPGQGTITAWQLRGIKFRAGGMRV